MGRISKVELQEYVQLGDDANCYFCDKPAVMWDLTPNQAASPMLLASYEGAKVRVKCCDFCWRKIYTANVAKGGVGYGVPRGMMTLDQKQHLLGTKAAAESVAQVRHPYTISKDPKMVMPQNMLVMDDAKFLWNQHILYTDELMYLQGAMSIRMLGLPNSLVERALLSGLNAGELEETRISIYREMLELTEANDAQTSV
jgi:hypothetical protein